MLFCSKRRLKHGRRDEHPTCTRAGHLLLQFSRGKVFVLMQLTALQALLDPSPSLVACGQQRRTRAERRAPRSSAAPNRVTPRSAKQFVAFRRRLCSYSMRGRAQRRPTRGDP